VSADIRLAGDHAARIGSVAARGCTEWPLAPAHDLFIGRIVSKRDPNEREGWTVDV